uniref:Protein RFT1 homolog n=1 Tax=Anisakis simplex TaxID=6269 RepID=A0A0M3KJJ3_ANISI
LMLYYLRYARLISCVSVVPEQQVTLESQPTYPLEHRVFSTSELQMLMKKRDSQYRKKNAVIVRSLVISGFNLICNLPSHLLRALWTFEFGQELMSQEWMKYVEGLFKILCDVVSCSHIYYLVRINPYERDDGEIGGK